MIIHTCHAPSTYTISVPAAIGITCPFCSDSGYKRGKPCSSCGTVEPSPKAELTAHQLLQRKFSRKPKKRKPARKLETYVPEVDGTQGETHDIGQNELAEYAADLDRLVVDVEDDVNETDALLPTLDEVDSLPW